MGMVEAKLTIEAGGHKQTVVRWIPSVPLDSEALRETLPGLMRDLESALHRSALKNPRYPAKG